MTFRERLISTIRRVPPLAGAMNAGGRARADTMLKHLEPWLPPGGRVIEIGTGTGHIAQAVERTGRPTVACDLVDLALAPVRRVLADGAALPVGNGRFDAALLVTVLHHVPAALHGALLVEAARVLRPGGRLLLLEDTYAGRVERAATCLADSIVNLEFTGHPHSNRDLAGWRALLAGLGLPVIHAHEYTKWFGPFRFRHAVIVIEPSGPGGRASRGGRRRPC